MSLFNFIVDPNCPPDTVYFVDTERIRLRPIWISQDGREFYNVGEIDDQHLRGIVTMLLRRGSKQYWMQKDDTYKSLFQDLDRRGLWTDAEELQSRLEGVVKRKQAA